MSKINKIRVNGLEIALFERNNDDFFCLTNMFNSQDGEQHIKNWMKNKNTLEFLAAWESIHNPNFNMVEFDLIKNEAGVNRFLMSVKQWVERTGAIGIESKSGRYGGTYAHSDIAMEFAMWISPQFKLLVIQEYRLLKSRESNIYNIEWNFRRFLSKANYSLQTDAIKENLIPLFRGSHSQEFIVYAEEADLLNIAVFGITAKEWRDKYAEHQNMCSNIRDCANLHQLNVLANLEATNSLLIRNNIPKEKRLLILKEEAKKQLESLSKLTYDYQAIQSPNLKYSNSQITESAPISFGEVMSTIAKSGKPKTDQ